MCLLTKNGLNAFFVAPSDNNKTKGKFALRNSLIKRSTIPFTGIQLTNYCTFEQTKVNFELEAAQTIIALRQQILLIAALQSNKLKARAYIFAHYMHFSNVNPRQVG